MEGYLAVCGGMPNTCGFGVLQFENWLWYSAARQDVPWKEGKPTSCPNIRCFKTWTSPKTHKTQTALSKVKQSNKSAVQLQVTSLHVSMHCCKHLYFLTSWQLNHFSQDISDCKIIINTAVKLNHEFVNNPVQ